LKNEKVRLADGWRAGRRRPIHRIAGNGILKETSMAFATMNFSSPAIGKASAFNVILPESEHPGPYPVMYLLHGLSDDHTVWSRRTSIERYVSNLPLIVVMPDTHRSWYTDAKQGYDYEAHIVQDVVGFADRHFNTIKNRTGRVISGLSMGGYGAMKLGLKYPNLFCSISSHSSAFTSWRVKRDDRFAAEIRRVFGEHPDGGPNDVYELVKNIGRDMLPRIRFDCGKEDFLIAQNRAFHKRLDKLRIPHVYEEFPGIHEWSYWDKHIQQSIKFHWESLKGIVGVK
jgi:putative tributyrin esterase